jgi:hypothetical protein
MAVVPADSEACRFLLEHLLDHASAHRLGNPLRLDNDEIPACAVILCFTSERDS